MKTVTSFIIVLLLITGTVIAQDFGAPVEENTSGAQAKPSIIALPQKEGETTEVVITFEVAKGKHIYSALKSSQMGSSTTFTWGGEGYELVGEVIEPEPHKHVVKIGEEKYTNWEFTGTVKFRQKIKITDLKKLNITLAVYASCCDAILCLEYNEKFSMDATGGAFSTYMGEIGEAVPQIDDVIHSKEKKKETSLGIFSSIWQGIGAGLIALLTPCVFPMVPITVSFFMKQGGDSRSSQIRMALVYCFGLIFFFVGLGLVLAFLMKMDVEGADVNQFANNPYINMGIGIVFLLFAFSFMGAFELRPPQWLMNKASNTRKTGGYTGILLMGFTFAITSFTCTAPIVGSALSLAVNNNNFMTPFFVMLGFSGIIAFLFFFLAMFPSLLSSLPKSGGWLGTVKVVLGFLELGLAFKFFRSVDINWQIGLLSHDMILILWSVILLFTALYLFGTFRFLHDAPVEGMSVTRVMLAMLFMIFAIYFSFGLLGSKLNSQIEGFILKDPPDYPSTAFVTSFNRNDVKATTKDAEDDEDDGEFHPDFINDYEAAHKKAVETGRPLFIDFTGKT